MVFLTAWCDRLWPLLAIFNSILATGVYSLWNKGSQLDRWEHWERAFSAEAPLGKSAGMLISARGEVVADVKENPAFELLSPARSDAFFGREDERLVMLDFSGKNLELLGREVPEVVAKVHAFCADANHFAFCVEVVRSHLRLKLQETWGDSMSLSYILSMIEGLEDPTLLTRAVFRHRQHVPMNGTFELFVNNSVQCQVEVDSFCKLWPVRRQSCISAVHAHLRASGLLSTEYSAQSKIYSCPLATKMIHQTANPHLQAIDGGDWIGFVVEVIKCFSRRAGRPVRVLQVGESGKFGGSFTYQKVKAAGSKPCDFEWYMLDLSPSPSNHNPQDPRMFFQEDITDPHLMERVNATFDILYTSNTFEHILNPWDATANVLNLLNEKGLFIFSVPFSSRYHAFPFDTFRYSHIAAQYLFVRLGGLRTVFAVYAKSSRDEVGHWHNMKDATLDGAPFTENIQTVLVAERDSTHSFDISSLG